MDAVLSEAGLQSFSPALAAAGISDVSQLAAQSEEQLVALGMRKLHINKLQRALSSRAEGGTLPAVSPEIPPLIITAPAAPLDSAAQVRPSPQLTSLSFGTTTTEVFM